MPIKNGQIKLTNYRPAAGFQDVFIYVILVLFLMTVVASAALYLAKSDTK